MQKKLVSTMSWRLLLCTLFVWVRMSSCQAVIAETEIHIDSQHDSMLQAALPGSISKRKGNPTARMPSFENGGLVFFLHVPKTGGTTIRRNLETLDRIDYVFGRNFSVYWEESQRVEEAILHGTVNSTVLFFEIHANDAPSLYRMRKRLQRWRDTAKDNNVSVFFFSLVRDPISFALSHFSFFHVQKRNPTFEQCNATEDNFLRLSLWNPQCQFLFRGEPSLRAQKSKNLIVTREECQEVQQHMWELLDWVGTTERLSVDTLPLLSKLLNLPNNFAFERFKVSSDSGQVFKRENVTEATIDTILDMSTLDTEMYGNVMKQYQLLRPSDLFE